jgi:peptidoglycan/xylan/chitin deacetylase (PgdA/CDA1 family)
MPKQSKRVPVLITWDVDPDQWADLSRREGSLSRAIDLCEDLDICTTFFFTASTADQYPFHIERMIALDQEIGCHGLFHSPEEDYNRMSEKLQQEYIQEARQKLETVTGSAIRSFRSPRVKTSGLTLRLLGEYGFQTDSSVCSQRVDLISSNLINLGWLRAPRRPYHPHANDAFKRGNLPIMEVPVSAAALPFISSVLKVLGLRAMKVLFWLLYQESKRTGKPIVYLAHPMEFDGKGKRKKIKWRDFSPRRIRTHGLMARRWLFQLSGQSLYEATRELFTYIQSFPNVVFLTCPAYVNGFPGKDGS